MNNYTFRLSDLFLETSFSPPLYTREEIEGWFMDYELSDFLTSEQISQITKDNVWSKEKLAKDIVDYFYMSESAYETPALFKHFARVTMNTLMESYLLKLYTKFLDYDPLSSVDYVEEYTRTIDSEAKNTGKSSSNSSSNSSSSGLNVNSDTPQGQINKTDILNGAYASSTSASEGEAEAKQEDETNTESQGSGKTLEKYTHSMKGDNGVIVTNQYLVREFRELAVNLNEELFKEIKKRLFMCIY